MIKDLGEISDEWTFEDQCAAIENYQMADHSGFCYSEEENRPDHCAK